MSAPIVHKPPPEGGIRVINAAQPWGLRNLFSGVVQGAWCDPEAGNTQFQDAAATAPVTAVEQQLGARLDRSGWRHHATQATAGKRPLYSRRVNVLTKTEQFSDAVWAKNSGTTVSDRKVISGTGNGYQGIHYSIAVAAGSEYITSCRVRAAGYTRFTISDGAFSRFAFTFDLTSGVITESRGVNYASATITSAGSGEFVITLRSTFAQTVYYARFSGNPGNTAFAAGALFTGDGVSGVEVWDVGVPLATDAHLPYQRVNTATDYDAAPAKFPAYLTANGTTSMMQSATGAGGTTGFYYCAPIRLLKLGAVQVLWSDATGNTGYEVRINASNQLELSAGTGAARVSVASAALVLGRTYILTAMHDGAALSVQVDSGAPVSAACGPIAAGTAGYTLFRAAGTDTGYANVREYGFVYTKNHCPSATHRAMAAQILAAKARITL